MSERITAAAEAARDAAKQVNELRGELRQIDVATDAAGPDLFRAKQSLESSRQQAQKRADRDGGAGQPNPANVNHLEQLEGEAAQRHKRRAEIMQLLPKLEAQANRISALVLKGDADKLRSLFGPVDAELKAVGKEQASLARVLQKYESKLVDVTKRADEALHAENPDVDRYCTLAGDKALLVVQVGQARARLQEREKDAASLGEECELLAAAVEAAKRVGTHVAKHNKKLREANDAFAAAERKLEELTAERTQLAATGKEHNACIRGVVEKLGFVQVGGGPSIDVADAD